MALQRFLLSLLVLLALPLLPRSGAANGAGAARGPEAASGANATTSGGGGRVIATGDTAPAIAGSGGAVASGHALATAAGLAVLRAGGNAVDGAVATALALAVVYPEAGNLGGGGFAVVRAGGAVRALDFRETAPAAARAESFLDPTGRAVPGASQVGPLAAGTPGSPAGLHELQRTLGRLPWSRVVAPAIRLAADGFDVDDHLREVLANQRTRQLLARFPESAQVWLPSGEPPPAGSHLRLAALAATLARYAEHGPEAITGGPVASAVAAAVRRHGGLLTAADLAAYRPVWREPLTFGAFGWQVASMPLPSSGGIILAQSCAILERLGWAALPRAGADRAHLLAETFRRAFADRYLLGDPATSRATAAQLLDPRWIASRAAGIDRLRSTRSEAVGRWPGEAVRQSAGSETTHLSVVDGSGDAVSLTTTLNGLFGCGLYVPEIGFLNNEMDDFAITPDQPTASGLIQGAANAVGPGKRMLSSMAPTIAWRGGEVLALGARGDLRIPTHLAQVFLNLVVDGDSLQQAVDRPRLHQQWFPDRLEIEPGALSGEVRAELERRGFAIKGNTPEVPTAKVNAVRRFPAGDLPADPSGECRRPSPDRPAAAVRQQAAAAAATGPQQAGAAARCEAAVDPRGAAELGGAAVLVAERQRER
ncbi:MAG TPA: gamma-glutamyltransferase [Thermoanaerobaculia bacterium]|nr:gamma-glutamyltransferase [Thermoanaerobaculia bacterium]